MNEFEMEVKNETWEVLEFKNSELAETSGDIYILSAWDFAGVAELAGRWSTI